MGDLTFVIKSFLASVCLLWLLQFKMGPTTLEKKTTVWVQTSSASSNLRDVAHGAIRLTLDGAEKVRSWIAGRTVPTVNPTPPSTPLLEESTEPIQESTTDPD